MKSLEAGVVAPQRFTWGDSRTSTCHAGFPIASESFLGATWSGGCELEAPSDNIREVFWDCGRLWTGFPGLRTFPGCNQKSLPVASGRPSEPRTWHQWMPSPQIKAHYLLLLNVFQLLRQYPGSQKSAFGPVCLRSKILLI